MSYLENIIVQSSYTKNNTSDFTEDCTEKHNEKYKKNIKKNIGKCETYFKMNKWDLETDYPAVIEYFASCILDDFIVYLLDNLKFGKSDDLMICIDDLCILEDISYECSCSYKDHNNDEFKNTQTICLIETVIELVHIIKNIRIKN